MEAFVSSVSPDAYTFINTPCIKNNQLSAIVLEMPTSVIGPSCDEPGIRDMRVQGQNRGKKDRA